MEDLSADERLMAQLGEAYNELKKNKPNDRSEKDRRYAVTITEMEKVLGYFYLWVVKGDELPLK